MDELFIWMTENAHWLWLSSGVLLLAGEMVLPGVFLLWIGLAGIVTGIAAWIFPGMEFEAQGLIFAALGTIAIIVGRKYYYGQTEVIEAKPINTRGQKFVGQVFTVAEPITNGRGHVNVGDSRWLAEGPDTPEGEKVRVISVEGTILKVESVTE